MPGQLSNRRRLLIRPEATFGLSANIADNAAGALPFDVLTLSIPEGVRELLTSDRAIGENEPTPMLIGGGVAKQSFSWESKSFDGIAGDAINASTVVADAMTRILENATQTRATTTGRTGTVATFNVLTAAAGTFTKNDLIVFRPTTPLAPDRANWSRIASLATPYQIDPNVEANGAGIAYGAEQYTKPDSQQAGGWLTLLSLIDGIQYELTGCRLSTLKAS